MYWKRKEKIVRWKKKLYKKNSPFAEGDISISCFFSTGFQFTEAKIKKMQKRINRKEYKESKENEIKWVLMTRKSGCNVKLNFICICNVKLPTDRTMNKLNIFWHSIDSHREGLASHYIFKDLNNNNERWFRYHLFPLYCIRFFFFLLFTLQTSANKWISNLIFANI